MRYVSTAICTKPVGYLTIAVLICVRSGFFKQIQLSWNGVKNVGVFFILLVTKWYSTCNAWYLYPFVFFFNICWLWKFPLAYASSHLFLRLSTVEITMPPLRISFEPLLFFFAILKILSLYAFSVRSLRLALSYPTFP